MTAIFIRTVLFWFLMAVAIMANAIFAGLELSPRIGEYRTHVYKSFVAILIVLLASFWMAASTGMGHSGTLWFVGFVWLVMTVLFEFVAGHYLFGNSWSKLVADYRLWKGRLWVLVLAAELIGPALMGSLRK